MRLLIEIASKREPDDGRRKLISEAVHFDIQAAADLHALSANGLREFPSCIPPWWLTWCEWTAPKQMRIGTSLRAISAGGHRLACLCAHLRSPDMSSSEIVLVFYRSDGVVIAMTTCCLTPEGQVSGSGAGIVVPDPRTRELINIPAELEGSVVEFMIKPVLMAFCLANCRNVQTTAVPIPDAIRRKRERNKRPQWKEYVLNIGAPPIRSTVHGSGKAAFIAQHLCRGHFKTFTPEKPLFGRLTGSYWWPMHVRGNEAAGAVLKDYKLGEVG